MTIDFAELRRRLWGEVSRRVEQYVATGDDLATARLSGLAVKRARSDSDAADRATVAARVRNAIAASGLTAGAFAAEVDTSASRLSTYANGRVMPSAAMLLRIERRATAPN